jgi:hypothetical protein
VTELRAILKETAPDSVEYQTTVMLHERPIPDLVIDTMTFDPTMFQRGDSPLIAKLAECLRKEGISARIHVRLYSLRIELTQVIVQAAADLAALICKIKDEFANCCANCGCYNIVKITE